MLSNELVVGSWNERVNTPTHGILDSIPIDAANISSACEILNDGMKNCRDWCYLYIKCSVLKTNCLIAI